MQVMHDTTISSVNFEVNLTKHGELYFAEKDLLSYYMKKKKSLSFVLWNKYFHSLNETFHLSTH